ncbi:uncharacterized protein [Physeter macrocephalus]|uniref:DPEP2 neighbor protein n=1 Tax=Physeter macrocephalus TaxID=9755 RepID=A0A9W2WKR9_PHYMC|nr:uncharacterized protein LOC129392022 [Physeter catodon]
MDHYGGTAQEAYYKCSFLSPTPHLDKLSEGWLKNPAAAAPVSPPTPGHYHVLYRGCGETQLGWHGETYCRVGGYRAYGDVSLATPVKVEAEKPVPRRAPKRKHALEELDEDLGCPRPKIRRLQHPSSLGIQGALILKQGGPTSGHIPSTTAPFFAAAAAPVSPPTPGHYHVLYRGCGETQLGWHGETYCRVGGYRAYGDVSLATPVKVEAEKPVPRRAPKRKHALEELDEDLGCPRPKIRRLQHPSSLGIQGALILKQGGPTSGHIPSTTAPVNECPIFAFSRSATGRGYSSLRCAGFSLQWLLLLRSTGSRRVSFSSCGSWALERRLSSCDAWA